MLCAGVIYEHGCDLLDGNGRIHGTRGTHIIHITMPDGLTEDAANALANKVDIDEERGRRRRTRFDRLPPLFKRSDMTATLSMPSASSTGKLKPASRSWLSRTLPSPTPLATRLSRTQSAPHFDVSVLKSRARAGGSQVGSPVISLRRLVHHPSRPAPRHAGSSAAWRWISSTRSLDQVNGQPSRSAIACAARKCSGMQAGSLLWRMLVR